MTPKVPESELCGMRACTPTPGGCCPLRRCTQPVVHWEPSQAAIHPARRRLSHPAQPFIHYCRRLQPCVPARPTSSYPSILSSSRSTRPAPTRTPLASSIIRNIHPLNIHPFAITLLLCSALPTASESRSSFSPLKHSTVRLSACLPRPPDPPDLSGWLATCRSIAGIYIDAIANLSSNHTREQPFRPHRPCDPRAT